jgi:amino acid transporter
VATQTELPRTLGVWSAAAIVVGITIGSGIFRSPAGVAERVADPLLVLGLWAVGGLLTLCGALSLAELAAAMPETGGFYAFLREGWGRLAGFLFGWSQLVLIRASALGGIAIAFGEYALRTFGVDPVAHQWTARLVAAAALAFAAATNIVGVNLGAVIVRLSTAAKFSALVAVAGSAFVLGGSHGATIENLVTRTSSPVTAGSLGLALVGVLWAYDGFGDLSFVAGEVREPNRNLPRAIIAGTAAIVTIYLLVNVAYLYVLPVETVGRSPLVAADTMAALFGGRGAAVVSSFVMISAFGALSGIMLASPRVFFAMANDGLFFRKIASVHPRFQTPHVAILLTTLLGMLLVASRTFEAVTMTFVVAVWPFYALSVAAVYRLRLRRPDLPRPYKVIGYPVVPAIFIAAVVWFVVNAFVYEPTSTAVTFALILSGVPVYFVVFGSRSAASRVQ